MAFLAESPTDGFQALGIPEMSCLEIAGVVQYLLLTQMLKVQLALTKEKKQ